MEHQGTLPARPTACVCVWGGGGSHTSHFDQHFGVARGGIFPEHVALSVCHLGL